MPPRKPKHTNTLRKEVLLPIDLVARVDLLLFDPVRGQARYGGWSAYVEGLIRRDLAARSTPRGGVEGG